MANPTTNKPTVPFLASGSYFGSTVQAAVGFCELNGPPLETINGIVARTARGQTGIGTGKYPPINATGFTNTPSPGPCRIFAPGSPAMFWPGVGWNAASPPANRTWAFVGLVNPYLTPGVTSIPFPIFGTGAFEDQSRFNCIGGTLTSSGITLFISEGYYGAFTMALSSYLTPGHVFAIAVSVSTAGGATRVLQVYDYTAQALVASLTTYNDTNPNLEAADGNPAQTNCNLFVNPQSIASNEVRGFEGTAAFVGLFNQAFNSTDFQNFYQDPWSMLRGTPSVSGSLTAGDGWNYHDENGTVQVGFSPARGTGIGGSGNPTYALTITDLKTGNTLSTPTLTLQTARNLWYSVPSPTAGQILGFRLAATDGSSTVYTPATGSVPIYGVPRPGANLGLAAFGDSRTESFGVPFVIAQWLSSRAGVPVNYENYGKSGAYSSSISNGVNVRLSLGFFTGTYPSSGTFILQGADNAGSNQYFNVNWNSTAAQLETILTTSSDSAAGGFDVTTVSCSGGPLPNTPITITGGGALASLAFNVQNYGSISIAPTVVVLGVGAPASAAMQADVAHAIANGLTIAHVAFGTNDMYASTPATVPSDYGNYIASFCAYWLSQGGSYVILEPPPLTRITTMTPASLQAGANYYAQLLMIAAANPGTVFCSSNNFQQYVIWNQFNSTDGLHPDQVEGLQEGTFEGHNIYSALNPSSGSGNNSNFQPTNFLGSAQ